MIKKKARPFEIGDLVVCSSRYGVGYVTDITETCIYIDDKIGVNPKLITAIRKPRKGGKEARDIVARCLLRVRRLRNTKHFTLKHDAKEKHPTICIALLFGYEIYRYQKSTLGDNNDN